MHSVIAAGSTPCAPCEPGEVLSEVGAFARETTHTEVRVIPLREHPRVAAGHHAGLDDGATAIAVGVDRAPRDVALQRNATDDPLPEPAARATTPFAPSAPTSVARLDARATDVGHDAVVAQLDDLDGRVVAKLRTGCHRLLGEVRVEPAALRHQDQRSVGAAIEPASVAEPELQRVDDVLDDG